MSRSVARTILQCVVLCCCAIGVNGCESTQRLQFEDRTDGMRVELFVRAPEQSFARYLVEKDGSIRYGGGFDALNRKFIWQDEMTKEEIDALRALLESNGWFEEEPPDGEGDRIFELWVRGPSHRNHLMVKGDAPAVLTVYDFLEHIARRRHEDLLRALPKPGRQPG